MFESYLKPRLTFPTLTGSIVTFNSQYAGLPLKSHVVEVVATQSGSGTPSPSNPRPITGYSAINISHSDADTSNPTVYTIQIGSTVYGGEYDARTGVLTATHGFVDLGSLNWLSYTFSGVPIFYTRITNKKQGSGTIHVNGMCDIYDIVETEIYQYDIPAYNIMLGSNSQYIYVNNPDYSSTSDFKTAMNGHLLVYELATPTTIQLPPCPIDTLLGENNIWADTGDTTLQYPKFG